MDEKMDEINLLDLFKVIKKHMLICCVIAVICGLAAYCVSNFLVEKKYTSSITMYVNNNATSTSININDINASQKLADTYVVIFRNGDIYKSLSEEMDEKYTAAQLKEIITLSVINSTEIIKIEAETNDPEESAEICRLFAELAPDELEKIVIGGLVKTIGEPTVNYSPSSPNVLKLTMVAMFAGWAMTAAIYVISSMIDTRIRSEKDITERYNIASLGIVPEQGMVFQQMGKQSGKPVEKQTISLSQKNPIIKDDTPFAIIEAYNKICANIRFGVSQEMRRVLVVTSSVPGEFKSTTSTNLAIALAMSGMRVLLVDADMRKPTLHNCVRVPNERGLSNILAGFCDVDDALYTEVRENLDFIPSGLIPPNPVTLLSSETAKKIFNYFGTEYDYVIIDSPPLNLISDAALISQYATGVLMVVREGKCTHTSVSSALQSLEIANANILGVIMTGGDISENPYNSYGYGYGYGYGYSHRDEESAAVRRMD